MKLVYILSLLMFVSACQTTEKSTCVEQDWYEIGRRSGVMGEMPHNLAIEFAACGTESKKRASSLYENGRNAGLTQYCQPSNAYELGKLNEPYNEVCPKGLESEFKDAYGEGKKIFELNIENTRLEIELDNLQRLKERNPNKTSLLKEIKNTNEKLKSNQSKIKKLTELEGTLTL